MSDRSCNAKIVLKISILYKSSSYKTGYIVKALHTNREIHSVHQIYSRPKVTLHFSFLRGAP